MAYPTGHRKASGYASEKLQGDGKMIEIYYIEDDENIATAVKAYLSPKG